jgi:hypothetical protein
MPNNPDSRTSYRVAFASDRYMKVPEGLSQHTHSGAAPSNDFNRMQADRQTQTGKHFKQIRDYLSHSALNAATINHNRLFHSMAGR